MSTVLKRQKLVCAGCGKTITAKLNVTPETMHDEVLPPDSWFRAVFTGQDANYGSVMFMEVYGCTEEHAQQVVNGGGLLAAYIADFKSFLQNRGANVRTDVNSIEETEYEEEDGDDDDSGHPAPIPFSK